MIDKSQIPYELELQIAKEKHGQIKQILHEEDIDCWIIFVRETMANKDPIMRLAVAGEVVWDTAFIFSLQDDKFQTYAIIGNFDSEAEKEKNLWSEVIPYTEGISQDLKSKIKQLNPTKIALNYSRDNVIADGLSHGMYLKLTEILENYKDRFVSADKIISKVRSRKTKTELDLIVKATQLTQEINVEITKKLTSGLNEVEIQRMFHETMDKRGVKEAWHRPSCPAIDVTSAGKNMGHVGPSLKFAIGSGHTLHNDFGIQYQGYCSDIQRMWFFGEKGDLPDELDHGFKTVHMAITKAAEFIKPGVQGWQVDKIARDYVVSQGYEEFKHALGHQVGMTAHDGALILGPLWERYGDTPKGIIEAGYVFTFELHVITKNYGGVSLEEMIIVTEDGCEFLIPRQMDWIYLPLSDKKN